jgi:hypothetical protein
LAGAERLAKLKSWTQAARERDDAIGASLREGAANDVPITRVVRLGPAAGMVTPGEF